MAQDAVQEELSNEFEILHQKVALAVDLRGRLHGYVELVLCPSNPNLRTVYLNSRQCKILKVSLDGHGELPFAHIDPLAPEQGAFKPNDTQHLSRAFPELKRKLYSAINEASEGELAISLPTEAVKKAEHQDEAAAKPTFEPVVVKIEYECINPKNGVRFAGVDCSGTPLPHAYTNSNINEAARCWMPCVDDLKTRHTWDIELTVSSTLSIADGDDLVEEYPIVAIASGELIEQVAHPSSSTQTIFRYAVSKPTTAQHIAFAVGPFRVYDFPATQHLHAFYLPIHDSLIENSIAFLPRAREAMIAEAGTYPFEDYKAVFVDDSAFCATGTPVHNGASMTVFPGDLLHPAAVIEQAYDTRQIISHAFAQQWFGILVLPKAWEDTWLITGLALRLASLALRKLLGNNEYRFRLRKDVERCCKVDVAMPPLCQTGRPTPLTAEELAFVNLKAPLVLHALDRQLLKSGSSVGLTRVLNQLSNSIVAEALKGNLLSTHAFFRICRKLTRNDAVRAFAQQWVFSSGCPRFLIKREFDRKRMCIYLTVRQESPAWDHLVTTPFWADSAHLRPVQIFEGQMTVRIHEADGTPYEHVLDIRDPEKRHEVPFNTKYKRVRRGMRRFGGRTAQAAAAAAGDIEAREEMTYFDPSFDYPPWEDEKERKRWKVHDWTDEDINQMEPSTFEWIRLDAEFEWIALIVHEQPAEQWIAQLQSDRDVIAQLDAVQGLGRIPSKIVASHLCKTVLVKNYFYRVRIEAVYNLVKFCQQSLDWLGLIYLIKIFQLRYCFPPRNAEENDFEFDYLCLPKPNDFSDLAEYHVQKALVVAISQLRDSEGQPFKELQQTLIGLLRYNDNGRNNFSDSDCVSTIMAALSHSLIPAKTAEINEFVQQDLDVGVDPAILGEAMIEIDRYLSMDRLVPSHRNAVTIAALEWKTKMMLASLCPVNMGDIIDYTREGNYPAVRSAAFDCLLLARGMLDDGVAEYVFDVIRHDLSDVVKRRLAQSVLEWTFAFFALEDLGREIDDTLFMEYEGGVAPPKSAKNSTERSRTIEALKLRVGKRRTLRENVLNLLLSAETDMAVRMTLLKLCDVVLTPKAESLPKIKLRMSTSAVPKPRRGPRLFSSAFHGEIATAPAAMQLDPSYAGAAGDGAARSEVPMIRMPMPKIKLPREPVEGEMSVADQAGCKTLLKRINKSDHAIIFRNPVDPIRDNVPTYFTVVTNPMDLGTIRSKFDSGAYKSRHELRDDFKLIVDNAILFNGEASAVGQRAKALNADFDRAWRKVEHMLEKHQAGQSAMMTPATNIAPSTSFPPVMPVASTSAFPLDEPFGMPIAAAPMLPPPVPASRPTVQFKLGPTLSSPMAAAPTKRKINYAEEEDDDDFDPNAEAFGGIHSRPTLSLNANVAKPKPRAPPTPVTVSGPAGPMLPKVAMRILQKIMDMDESFFFREPVSRDLTIYFEMIEKPISLHEIADKVEDGGYENGEALDADFRLLAANCRKFNPPESVAVGQMNLLVKTWNDEWRRYEQAKRKAMKDVVKQLLAEPSGMLFAEAVDPVRLNIPNYFDVIKPEDARDLSLISNKAGAGEYQTWQDFDADLRLMIRNALTYNREGDAVYNATLGFDQARDRLVEPYLTNGFDVDPRPAKKARIA